MKLLSISWVIWNYWDLSKPSLCLAKAEAIRILRNVCSDFVVYLTLILMCNHCLEGAQGRWQIIVLWFRTLFPCSSCDMWLMLLLLPALRSGSTLPDQDLCQVCLGKVCTKGWAPGSVCQPTDTTSTGELQEKGKDNPPVPNYQLLFTLSYFINSSFF